MPPPPPPPPPLIPQTYMHKTGPTDYKLCMHACVIYTGFHFSQSGAPSHSSLSSESSISNLNCFNYEDINDLPSQHAAKLPFLVTWMTILPLTSLTQRYHQMAWMMEIPLYPLTSTLAAKLSYLDDCLLPLTAHMQGYHPLPG